jgi:hypothetical protein
MRGSIGVDISIRKPFKQARREILPMSRDAVALMTDILLLGSQEIPGDNLQIGRFHYSLFSSPSLVKR